MDTDGITAEAIEIAGMQQDIYNAGWQWLEHVFNDKSGWRNCLVYLSKSTSPHAFDRNYDAYDPNKVAWGRFDRIDAWRQAHEYVMCQERANGNQTTK